MASSVSMLSNILKFLWMKTNFFIWEQGNLLHILVCTKLKVVQFHSLIEELKSCDNTLWGQTTHP